MVAPIELVTAAGEAFDRRDWERLRELYHTAARVHTIAGGDEAIGIDEMIGRTAAATSTVWYSVSIDRLEALDEHAVVALGSVRSAVPGGGHRLDQVAWLTTIKDDRLYRSVVVASEEDARRLYVQHGICAGICGTPST